MKIIINPKYQALEPLVRKLIDPSFFSQNGTTIYDKRNTIKVLEVDGLKLVIKSYGHITTFNRLIYGKLRKSKALRAQLFAERLRGLGIDTPEEVAMLEQYRHGLLDRSYFISRYTDDIPLRQVIECQTRTQAEERVLESFADFLFQVHQAGVLHKDLNIDNVLFHEEGGSYKFQFIDINRMSFRRKLSLWQRLYNVRRFRCTMADYLYILDCYAKRLGVNPDSAQLWGVLARVLFEFRIRSKKAIKGLVRKR